MGIGLLKPETSASQDKKSKHCKPHVEDDQQICEMTETGNFDCNICLESTQDPVVTLCGHLFCWSCLYHWLELHSSSKECPVCKAHVDEKTVIPLYGRGKTSLSDPRKKPALGITIPARPQGFRSEHSPQVATGLHSHGTSPRVYHGSPHGGGQVAFSSGFGLFPSLLGLQMTGQYGFSGSHHPPSGHYGFSGTAYSSPIGTQANMFHTHRFYQQQEAFLYWLFILLACFAMACLLFF